MLSPTTFWTNVQELSASGRDGHQPARQTSRSSTGARPELVLHPPPGSLTRMPRSTSSLMSRSAVSLGHFASLAYFDVVSLPLNSSRMRLMTVRCRSLTGRGLICCESLALSGTVAKDRRTGQSHRHTRSPDRSPCTNPRAASSLASSREHGRLLHVKVTRPRRRLAGSR